DILKIRGDSCFLRQLHLHPAVTYVHVSSLGCKFASLACRLSQRYGSLLTLSTSWTRRDYFPARFAWKRGRLRVGGAGVCFWRRWAADWDFQEVSVCKATENGKHAAGKGAASLDLSRTGETGRRPYRGSAAVWGTFAS